MTDIFVRVEQDLSGTRVFVNGQLVEQACLGPLKAVEQMRNAITELADELAATFTIHTPREVFEIVEKMRVVSKAGTDTGGTSQ